jgi:ankyrin repeat protein
LLLSKDKSNRTACHKAAETGHVEVLEKLRVSAKELQLKPEELSAIYLFHAILSFTDFLV